MQLRLSGRRRKVIQFESATNDRMKMYYALKLDFLKFYLIIYRFLFNLIFLNIRGSNTLPRLPLHATEYLPARQQGDIEAVRHSPQLGWLNWWFASIGDLIYWWFWLIWFDSIGWFWLTILNFFIKQFDNQPLILILPGLARRRRAPFERVRHSTGHQRRPFRRDVHHLPRVEVRVATRVGKTRPLPQVQRCLPQKVPG